MAERAERVSERGREGGVEGEGKREEGREQRLVGESEVRGRGKTVGEKGRCFLLTAILWLLLQLKWFNIHLLVQGSEVRTASSATWQERRLIPGSASASGAAQNERPSFSIIAVLHKAL